MVRQYSEFRATGPARASVAGQRLEDDELRSSNKTEPTYSSRS